MTDSDKARALGGRKSRIVPLEGDNDELLDPVKVFNVYGYNSCGNDSICLAGLWRNAGLKVAPARLVGHCVTQVFYNGSWHVMDGDDSITERNGNLVAEQGKTGVVVWTMSSPYVFVGGRIEVEGIGAKFKLSWDGASWHEIDRKLDVLFPPEGPARYRYYLKCELTGDAHLRRLEVVNDLQMAPLTLPGMGVGTNAFTYTDESASRRVRISQQWVERSASRPPGAPPGPIFPPSGGGSDGTEIVFQWQPADRSRRRRDRRLPLRALGTPRHEMAAVDELRETHLPDSRCRPGSLHAGGARPSESRHGVFLARPRPR